MARRESATWGYQWQHWSTGSMAVNKRTVQQVQIPPEVHQGVMLKETWTDPNYDPDQQAYYYVRVLENPSCRWSTWDAIRLGIEPNPDLPAVHQERAWSSPIWYQP
jgi:hypothetical protein